MENVNANYHSLEQVFNVITNLHHDFEWPPYWIGSSGRHLENRTWVRPNFDKAYSKEHICQFSCFYEILHTSFLYLTLDPSLALCFDKNCCHFCFNFQLILTKFGMYMKKWDRLFSFVY